MAGDISSLRDKGMKKHLFIGLHSSGRTMERTAAGRKPETGSAQ